MGNDMKYAVSLLHLDKANQKELPPRPARILMMCDALIRAVRDDLAEMPEYAHCEIRCVCTEPVQSIAA